MSLDSIESLRCGCSAGMTKEVIILVSFIIKSAEYLVWPCDFRVSGLIFGLHESHSCEPPSPKKVHIIRTSSDW